MPMIRLTVPAGALPEEGRITIMGRCLLGIAHEGPPGYGHDGVSAMLLDELMGWACAAVGKPGMTISLRTRYQGPVPLETPLRVSARDGVLVAPDPEIARSLFPALDNTT